MSKVLRLGLLGTGVAANKLYLPALRAISKQVRLVACCNRSRPKAEAFAQAVGGCEVVDTAAQLFAAEHVDAVLISLPIEVQGRFVLQALRAGKPVLSEKPVAATLAQARKLVHAGSASGVPWLVGENYAFMPHVEQTQRWLKAGKLGQLRLIEVRQLTWMDANNAYFNTPWRQKPQHVGGFVTDGGVHLANVVRRCFGMPTHIKNLTAQFAPHLPPVDTAVAALRFESGALGTWTSCFSARHTGPMLRVYGARANLELGYDWAELTDAKGKVTRVQGDNGFTQELLHFRAMVQQGAAPRVSAAEALEDLRLLDSLVKRR